MDPSDMELLARLEEDHRVSYTELAQSLGLTRTTVRRRIRQLHEEGALKGYQIEINRLAIGFERLVYLEVKTNPRESWLPSRLESLEQCIQSAGVIGDYGLMFKMAFRSGAALARGIRSFDSLIASSASKRYRVVDVIEAFKERGTPIVAVPARSLDAVDLGILRILMDQRGYTPLPLWRIAGRLEGETGRKLSRSSIQKRVRRLQDWGVIQKFTIKPRRWNVGGGTRAFVRLKADPGRTSEIAGQLASRKEVVCLYRTGEDYGLFSEIFLHDLNALNVFLRSIYEIDGLLDSVTTIVLEARKETPVPSGVLLGAD